MTNGRRSKKKRAKLRRLDTYIRRDQAAYINQKKILKATPVEKFVQEAIDLKIEAEKGRV